MRQYIRTTFLLLGVAFVCFTAGLISWGDVRAEGFSPETLRKTVASVPDRVGMLLEQPQKTAASLPVRATYQETLNTIREKYYPDASILSTTVIKTPTNAVKGTVATVKPSLDVQQLTYMAIRGILASLGDDYTGFLDPEDYKKMREENIGNFVGIGAQLGTNKRGETYVREPLPGFPAIKAGVKKGDIILKVDAKSVSGMDIEDVVKLIRGPENTKVTLTLARGKERKIVVISIIRKVVEYKMVESDMLDKEAGIGWVQLRQFNDKADAQLDKAITDLESKRLKGLILDLRSNPGGLLEAAREIGSRFISSGPVVIIQERGGQRTQLDVDTSRHDHPMYPLVVLVDKMSASASEIVAGAIKDNRTGTLVGETTFGKGRVQTIVPLPGGAAVRITTAKYLTPKGIDIHKKGIEPDIEVKMPEELPEEEDLDEADRLKYDPQLTKAVEIMRAKLAGTFKMENYQVKN